MSGRDVTTDAAKSAEWRAREAALAKARARRNARIGHDCDGEPPCIDCTAFRAGWRDAMSAPPLPWILRSWRPVVADAYRAGRRARRSYERRRQDGASEVAP